MKRCTSLLAGALSGGSLFRVFRMFRIFSMPLAAALLGMALLGFGAGCAGSARTVDIDSKPTGAAIYVDGERRGLTRSKVELDFRGDTERRILIQVAKPRYKPILQYWTLGEVPDDGKKVFTLEAD